MWEIKQICKSYSGRKILHPISFVLGPGQSLGLTGENGSGKSTLLRLLAQIEQPDGGEILFHGKNIQGNRRFLRKHIGYVPQEDSLMPELTTTQQLKLWQSACGLRGPLPKDILALMGLEDILKKKIADLSGGMRKRVSITMALLSRPEILIMDEATAGLDESYCNALIDWLQKHIAAGGRLIWCTHKPEELELLCGCRMHLKGGKIQF